MSEPLTFLQFGKSCIRSKQILRFYSEGFTVMKLINFLPFHFLVFYFPTLHNFSEPGKAPLQLIEFYQQGLKFFPGNHSSSEGLRLELY